MFFKKKSILVSTLPEWLDMAAQWNKEFEVVLPMIQRGFVWKPNQIIELWDSLLQGMPIGTLMLSEMGAANSVGLQKKSSTGESDQIKCKIGLIDGQQRTLAMLIGWMTFNEDLSGHRLWVDFGDDPPPGQLLRLRVTTQNQPFGFQRSDPNSKLSQADRRSARAIYGEPDPERPKKLLAKASPHPAGAKISLPLDLAELINIFKTNNHQNDWHEAVRKKLENVKVVRRLQGKDAEFFSDWPTDDATVKTINTRINQLKTGLDKLLKAEIPLVRVDSDFFAIGKKNIEPPLAILFKRIGSNATKLSDADYVYSVLKHMVPEVHEAVEKLHGQGTVANLLTPTDLVMTTLRLSATGWRNEPDRDNPNKEDFHRMLWPKTKEGMADKVDSESGERQSSLTNLLGVNVDAPLLTYFKTVQENLELNPENNPDGLPRHMFPYLGRPLVQVLLRLAQVGFLTIHPVDKERRQEVLRLTLYWVQWTSDKGKASRVAFQIINKWETETAKITSNLGKMIYDELVKEKVGQRIQTPDEIKALKLHETHSSVENIPNPVCIGESRFETSPHEPSERKLTREFYRHWWHAWNYRHPMLLWLQREYVTKLSGNPMAGMEDDTPYDFDHILPYSHWGDLRSSGIGEFIEKNAQSCIGNAIGNVRVWDAPLNRSDGDDSPKIKMSADQASANDWLINSAIEEKHKSNWEHCSPTDDKSENKCAWSKPRAQAFQTAVEHRTFALYQRLYETMSYVDWGDQDKQSQ